MLISGSSCIGLTLAAPFAAVDITDWLGIRVMVDDALASAPSSSELLAGGEGTGEGIVAKVIVSIPDNAPVLSETTLMEGGTLSAGLSSW